MIGLSTSGIISLGCALVAGRKRVPSPAAGKTTLQTFRLMNPRAMVDNFTSLREPVPPLRGSVRFSTLPSTPPAAPCWARLSRPCGSELAAGFLGDKARQPLRIDRGLLGEANAHSFAATFDLGHTDAL